MATFIWTNVASGCALMPTKTPWMPDRWRILTVVS